MKLLCKVARPGLLPPHPQSTDFEPRGGAPASPLGFPSNLSGSPVHFYLTIPVRERTLGGFARVDEAGRQENGYLILKTYGGSRLFS
jgi:hypothetical protein